MADRISRADPDAGELNRTADERVNFRAWTPPQWGRTPVVRVGRRWINVFWAAPFALAALLIMIAASQALRETAWFAEFVKAYPGAPLAAPKVESGFPAWLRVQHFFNMFFMFFIIRAGLQILADHPRLYWTKDCTPGTEWFRFQHPVPRDRVWTSKDDSVTLSKWVGLPGLRHSIGLARWWHFSLDLLWLVNGVIFYALIFYTDQWKRVVPVTWEVFPNAFSVAVQYASLHFPTESTWDRYNGLQQITYFITIFVAAPVSIATGILQAPAVSNKIGVIGKVLNRQVARSIHFLSMFWFLFFILAHGAMVFATSLRENTNHMFAGVQSKEWAGLVPFLIAMGIVLVTQALASPFTIRHSRVVQRVGAFTVGWIKGIAEWWDPTTRFTEADISPRLWPNGTPPKGEPYETLLKNDFADFTLPVRGLVENPRLFTMAELKAMPKQEQITRHFCIQGWSGVAKWGGVPMRHIMDIVRPLPNAKFAVFYALSSGDYGGLYYDSHEMKNLKHELTLIAYEMNGKPLPVLHGAPLRLRVENELGFKMVKWIHSIEFVESFDSIGGGHGGYHEDHEFYGYKMPI